MKWSHCKLDTDVDENSDSNAECERPKTLFVIVVLLDLFTQRELLLNMAARQHQNVHITKRTDSPLCKTR